MIALLLLACRAPAEAEPRRCNGHAELCDRPLSEVALPGTHNSMSNADDGWMVPNQHHGIPQQLEDGVRGFLFDVHLGDDGLPALCHAYCSLGSTPLDEGLGWFKDFLDDHPDEVLEFIIEDALPAEDIAAVFTDVGLDRYTSVLGDADPTLGELIDADTRLLVTAESEGPPPDWYQHAWDLYWDTPYSFDTADDFNCDLNRGDPTNPLFLLNHWVGALPVDDNAAEVNTAAVLGARAEQCRDEWGHVPNIVAVDFYDEGDLFTVVDALNGF